MLSKEQKEEILAKVLQSATKKMYSRVELEHVIDRIDDILETALDWVDTAMVREMYDFVDTEARKKLGLELLSEIIKKRMVQ